MPPNATGVKRVADRLPLLAEPSRRHNDVTPVARKWLDYPEGTPQRALLSAVDARYNDSERFFEAVAKRAKITPDSASGTFYAFLKGNRALPNSHRVAYLALLKNLEPAVLDQIEALRTQPVATPKRRDRLAAVEKLADQNRQRIEIVLQEALARLADLEADLAPSARLSTRRKKA
jgi:hypothetical protein